MWQGWIDLIAGLWVLSCGFFNPLRTSVNMWIPGLVIFIFGLWAGKKGNSWQGFTNSLIGLWLFLSGLVFNLNVEWNFIVFGGLILLLSLWNVSANPNNSRIQSA